MRQLQHGVVPPIGKCDIASLLTNTNHPYQYVVKGKVLRSANSLYLNPPNCTGDKFCRPSRRSYCQGED